MTNKDILGKLETVISKEESQWHKDAQFRFENRAWLKRSQMVALCILRSLREQGLSQKDLAGKIGVSPQVVNRWVKGTENFTFETISKLEEALHIEILHVS